MPIRLVVAGMALSITLPASILTYPGHPGVGHTHAGARAHRELGRKSASWKTSAGMPMPSTKYMPIWTSVMSAADDSFSPCRHPARARP